MNTDIKELLTLAAKACGIVGTWELDHAYIQERYYFNVPYDNHGMLTGFEWAPHLDDGDGARMERKLRIDLAWCDGLGEVTALLQGVSPTNEKYADHNGDEQAARRWASLRAAAQEGRGMP